MKDIVYVFIDAQNLYLGIKSQGWCIDNRKFYIYLKEKYKAEEVYMYIGYIKENIYLYKSLESCGYKLVFKRSVKYGGGRRIKGNVDVDLTVDVIRKAMEYTTAIIISADGDFCALYNYLLKSLEKELLILIPNMHSYSSLLLEYRSRLRFLNDLKEKVGK